MLKNLIPKISMKQQKSEKDFRIFCLGGSTTRGPFPKLLHELLKRSNVDKTVEVVNLGIDVLHTMAKATKDVAELSLDVSHAFRHLPMIAMVAGVYLQAVQNITLQALWYGFYDPDTKTGTVYDLKGLLHLFDWVRSLSQFEHTGDYGVFTELLPNANLSLAAPMHKAAFFERTSQESLAKEKIKSIDDALKSDPFTGVARLFQLTLQDRLAWSHKKTPQRRQSQLAEDYLKRRDYLRATIYAQEAFVTYLVSQRGGDPARYADRQDAKDEYEKAKGRMSNSYKNLRELRNAMAHGTEPTRAKVKQMMKDEAKLREQILREQAIENFRGNLHEIISTAKRHQIPVILGTIVSNLRDWRPFDSEPPPPSLDLTQWQQLLKNGKAAFEQNHLEEAERIYQTAIELFPDHAQTHFDLGHVYLARGYQDKAKRSFTRARDLDILPIRAPSEVNETIKNVAKEADIILADLETTFQDYDPKNVIGKPMIVEHLHPSNEGYYLIASHLTHIIFKEGFLTASKRLDFDDPSLKRKLDIGELDKGALIRLRLMLKIWPFNINNEGYHYP